MAKTHFRTTTALVAGLSLLVPSGMVPTSARAQEVSLFCLDFTAPPCAAGEPEAGSLSMTQAEARAARRAARNAEDGDAAVEEDAAAAEAAAQAEADAAAQAEAEAAAQAEADAAAQAEADAAAQAEAEAAAQAEADAAAQAEADAAAQAEAEAAAQAEADAAAQAEADAAAQAEADAAAQAEAEAAAQAEADAAAQAEAEAAAQAEADAAAQAEAVAATEGQDAPVESDPTVEETPVAVEAAVSAEGDPEAAPVNIVTEIVEEPDVRTSEEDFATAVDGSDRAEAGAEAGDGNGDDGLSDLEKILLLGLGAVVVGAVLDNGDEVVSNSGDRVVVQSRNGLEIYKDDDALLRQAGTEITTQTFDDGSTLTTVTYADSSQVVTIRDPRGRVLRRTLVRADGTTTQLFDDLTPSAPVNVPALRAEGPAPVTIGLGDADPAALRDAMRAAMDYTPSRTYSLRQIREIEAVRALVPSIDLDTITFATGSAAIERRQARSLVQLGRFMESLLADNPQEVFLIEGHTDAVGSESYNLALSDRRAESVALALTEAFDIPPQNLIVQGYGEEFLKIETPGAEQRNRRASIRRITPLLNQDSAG